MPIFVNRPDILAGETGALRETGEYAAARAAESAKDATTRASDALAWWGGVVTGAAEGASQSGGWLDSLKTIAIAAAVIACAIALLYAINTARFGLGMLRAA